MGYESFKIVNGVDVPTDYRDHEPRSLDGATFRHEFSKHEALRKLLHIGLGWIDLHAMRPASGGERRGA
jgi:hypothetical protein